MVQLKNVLYSIIGTLYFGHVGQLNEWVFLLWPHRMERIFTLSSFHQLSLISRKNVDYELCVKLSVNFNQRTNSYNTYISIVYFPVVRRIFGLIIYNHPIIDNNNSLFLEYVKITILYILYLTWVYNTPIKQCTSHII